MEPNYYAIIPANVRYDKALKPNAKLLYGEITALAQRDGYCWATNEYFAALYEVDHKTISRWISQLRECGYIGVELIPGDGNKRKITIDKIVTTYTQKSHEVVTKKSRGSDKKSTPIYESITINNTIKRESTALAFLEQNFASQLETFWMQSKSQIGADLEKFKLDFEDKVTIELANAKITWDGPALLARMRSFARNWIGNNAGKAVRQNGGYNNQQNNAAPAHGRLEIKRRA